MFNTFVMYSNYYDILKDCPDKDIGAIFRAVLAFAKTGKDTMLPAHLKLAFGFLKNQMVIDEMKCQKSVEDGKKGGRPRKNVSPIPEDEIPCVDVVTVSEEVDDETEETDETEMETEREDISLSERIVEEEMREIPDPKIRLKDRSLPKKFRNGFDGLRGKYDLDTTYKPEKYVFSLSSSPTAGVPPPKCA